MKSQTTLLPDKRERFSGMEEGELERKELRLWSASLKIQAIRRFEDFEIIWAQILIGGKPRDKQDSKVLHVQYIE